jgi:hypothetical protein
MLRGVLRLTDLFHVAQWQDNLPWASFREGVDIYRLYGDGVTGPSAALLRFHAGAEGVLSEKGCIVLAVNEEPVRFVNPQELEAT